MQISKVQLFLILEGHENDAYFYLKICDPVCRHAGVHYAHRIAREVPPGAGGKNALISFFKHLKQKKLLVNEFKGKRTAFIFFADKDVDDLLRTQLKSPHFQYTRYYDVENHLFESADLAESAAAAASFDKVVLEGSIGNYEEWRANAAAVWKEWVKLCIFAQKKQIPGECNYGVTSKVNVPLTGPIDTGALAMRMAQIEAASGLSGKQFKRAFRNISKLVEDLYHHAKYDYVFKGKWYTLFLEAEIRKVAAGRPFNDRHLSSRILASVAATARFDDPWTDHFRDAVARVIALL